MRTARGRHALARGDIRGAQKADSSYFASRSKGVDSENESFSEKIKREKTVRSAKQLAERQFSTWSQSGEASIDTITNRELRWLGSFDNVEQMNDLEVLIVTNNNRNLSIVIYEDVPRPQDDETESQYLMDCCSPGLYRSRALQHRKILQVIDLRKIGTALVLEKYKQNHAVPKKIQDELFNELAFFNRLGYSKLYVSRELQDDFPNQEVIDRDAVIKAKKNEASRDFDKCADEHYRDLNIPETAAQIVATYEVAQNPENMEVLILESSSDNLKLIVIEQGYRSYHEGFDQVDSLIASGPNKGIDLTRKLIHQGKFDASAIILQSFEFTGDGENLILNKYQERVQLNNEFKKSLLEQIKKFRMLGFKRLVLEIDHHFPGTQKISDLHHVDRVAFGLEDRKYDKCSLYEF